jgi:hypothetical protein
MDHRRASCTGNSLGCSRSTCLTPYCDETPLGPLRICSSSQDRQFDHGLTVRERFIVNDQLVAGSWVKQNGKTGKNFIL